MGDRIPRLPYVRATTRAQTCRTFRDRAIATWKQMGATYRDAHFLPSEPTLTENNLYEIALRHGDRIGVHKTTGRQEARTGADWLWVCGSNDDWLSFLVQAKKLDIETGVYRELASADGLRQLERLVTAASYLNATPVYCLFNSMIPREYEYETPATACLRNGGRMEDLRMLGCSLVSASRLRPLVQSRRVSYSEVQQIAVPWECLMCCDCQASNSTEPIDFAKSMRLSLMGPNPQQTAIDDRLAPFLGEAPWYVQRLLSGEPLAAEEVGGAGFVVTVIDQQTGH